MQSLFTRCALVVCFTGSLIAQAIVLPAAAAGLEGSGANNFPWGLTTSAWPGLRIQTIYDSTNLTSQGVTGPIGITGIRWRCDGGQAPNGGVYAQATVAMASAAVDYAAATTTWTTNQNPDYTIVYSGPVNVLASAASTPGSWYVDVQFAGTPFYYDPTLGNDLIIDTDRIFTNNWTGSGSATSDTSNSLAGRVYASSMYPTANGVDFSSNPVIEIQFCKASFTQFGPGCAGTLGVPDLSPITTIPGISPLPRLGTTFGVTCTNAPLGLAFMVIGLNNTTWAGGGLPLPHNGAGFGAPGCFLRVSDDAAILLSGSGTSAAWFFGVPASTAFCSFQLFNQALVYSPGTNPLGYVVSNSYVTTVGM